MERHEILSLLSDLGGRLQARGIVGDLYVVGGAAIALAYDSRRATRDIDAVFVPKREIYDEAAALAQERHLPVGWLNDAVKGFLLGPDPHTTSVLDLPGLRVEVASPQVVLAMKCLAHRIGEDDGDVLLLAVALELTSTSEVLDLVAGLVGPRLLTAQVQFFVEAVMEKGSPSA